MKCPRCGGQIAKDYYEHVCLQCGFSPTDEKFRQSTLFKLKREITSTK